MMPPGAPTSLALHAAPTLTLDNVLVGVEMQDSALDGPDSLAAGACGTWLAQMPPERAVLYSDTDRSLPAACAGIANVRACCPGNASMGSSLATAQLKREHMCACALGLAGRE